MKVLITGVAGFIGMHVASALLARGDEVVGVDGLDDPFDVALTYARLARIQSHPRFRFSRLDIADRPAVDNCFQAGAFDVVVHLATQQGGAARDGRVPVRVHLSGFVNVLEGCRQHGVPHLVYASGSDVDGERRRGTRSEGVRDDTSPASRQDKRAGETLARAYSRLHGVATTGLRFFTVYGPWGRPDIGYHELTRGLLTGEPLPVYPREGEIGHGLTYVDDIVAGIERALRRPEPRDASLLPGEAPARVLNIGSHDPVRLLDFIAALEHALGRPGDLKVMPVAGAEGDDDGGDVSSEDLAARAANFLGDRRVTMPLAEGVQRFVHWYLSYHGMDPSRSTSSLRRAAVFEDPMAVQWLPAHQPLAQQPTPSRQVEKAGLRVL